ncbi:hypothetical protein PR048_014368 [Dryococelus australis]|uniref:Uncharacterized protein n=1 Tax=Dryococelus australis TaxID=614101 RepID=A0ABQ9HDZ7_9NEOP|nr:hypothetical protein PR048_014368 [Dryococelus australis]
MAIRLPVMLLCILEQQSRRIRSVIVAVDQIPPSLCEVPCSRLGQALEDIGMICEGNKKVRCTPPPPTPSPDPKLRYSYKLKEQLRIRSRSEATEVRKIYVEESQRLDLKQIYQQIKMSIQQWWRRPRCSVLHPSEHICLISYITNPDGATRNPFCCVGRFMQRGRKILPVAESIDAFAEALQNLNWQQFNQIVDFVELQF